MKTRKRRFLYDAEGDEIAEMLREGIPIESLGLTDDEIRLFQTWLKTRCDGRERIEVAMSSHVQHTDRLIRRLSRVFGRYPSPEELRELAEFLRRSAASVMCERDRAIFRLVEGDTESQKKQAWLLNVIWPKVQEERKCRRKNRKSRNVNREVPASNCARTTTKTRSSSDARSTSRPTA